MTIRPKTVIHGSMLCVYAAFVAGKLAHRDGLARCALAAGALFCIGGLLALAASYVRGFASRREVARRAGRINRLRRSQSPGSPSIRGDCDHPNPQSAPCPSQSRACRPQACSEPARAGASPERIRPPG
ncbi:hypothetical protein [Singulisphaera sp. PoT]|uniref:hypothetical protein n=1 Tax=Singulisphaera sp. PoT TaxID=3411797 RepID=UPI003BF4A00A